jgi:hypothetical protein
VALLESALQELGEPAADPRDLAEALSPDSVGEYQSLVEQEWRRNVLIAEE